MRRLSLLLFAIFLFVFHSMAQFTSTSPEKAMFDCEWWRDKLNLPAHYCLCSEDAATFSFPMDVIINDVQWYKVVIDDFRKGFTAYLYSDCMFKMDIYGDCALSSPSYSYTLSPNQTRDVDSETIEEKLQSLESMGLSGMKHVYLCIYPVNGVSGRFICLPYNQGYHSTCSNLLELIPSMVFVSSHENDVYVLNHHYIPNEEGLALYWEEPNLAICHMSITRETCYGDTVAMADLVAGEPYYIDDDLMASVRESGENLYFHFSHDIAAVGRIRLKNYEKAPIVTPTSIRQIEVDKPSEIVIDKNGLIYIQRGNQRYSLLGNKI